MMLSLGSAENGAMNKGKKKGVAADGKK